MKVLDGHVLLTSPKIWPHFRRRRRLLCFPFFAVNFLPGEQFTCRLIRRGVLGLAIPPFGRLTSLLEHFSVSSVISCTASEGP